MKGLWLSILIGLAWWNPSLAFTASDSGQEGSHRNSAWFLATKESGNGVIRACAKARNREEEREIAKLVKWSLSAWDAYYVMLQADLNDHGDALSITLRGWEEVNPKCNGKEDLTVYYGVEDERVRAVKSRYANPLGFAHLESFNEKTGEAHGFIWISDAPEVRMHENHRRLLIHHEIGHTFGLGHVPGTVMEENFADTITNAFRTGVPFDPVSRRGYKGNDSSAFWVNFEQSLSGWQDISFSYHRDVVELIPGTPKARAFEALTGEPLTGRYEFGYQRLVSWPDETDKEWEPKGKGRFEIWAGERPGKNPLKYFRDFKVEYAKPYWLPLGEEKLFRAEWKGKEQFIPRRALIYPGVFVETKTGRRTEFLLQRHEQELDINVILNGEKITL